MAWLVALLICFFPLSSFASDENFVGASNWGGTGLLELPSARVLPVNSFRIGIGQMDPFRYYYGCISPFAGLEIDGRVTEILGAKITDPGWGGYGNDKDKAIDLKYQILAERKYLPAFSIGLMDPHGTRLYSSQYLVISKQIFPFDFTVGIGNGRFGKQPLPGHGEGLKIEMFQQPRQWLSDAQVFGGIEFSPCDQFGLILEYNPMRYHLQRGAGGSRYFKEPVPSKFNFGLRIRPTKWTEIDLSYQRGNQLGLNFSMAFDIGKPLIPIYDHPYKESPSDVSQPFTERLEKAMACSGFSDISVWQENGNLFIEAQNDKYLYTPRAWRAVLNIVHDIAPAEFNVLHISLTDNGIPMSNLDLNRADMKDLFAGRLTLEELAYLSRYGISSDLKSAKKGKFRKTFGYAVRPSLETFLNDPSGFFRYRIGISGSASYQPWTGGSFVAGLAGYPVNTVSSVNEPIPNAVRSDIVLYKREQVSLEKCMFNQIRKVSPQVFGRLGVGLLEIEYAGLDGEIAAPFLDGRIIMGLGSSLVRKRSPDKPFSLKEDDTRGYYTAFINTRINFPELDAYLDLKTGRFLAGDKGVRITLSKCIRGVVLSAWYSFTDTSVFSDSFNQNYHDKGFAVSIPIRIFQGKDKRGYFNYSLSPWTRDVAQDIAHYHNLLDFIGRNVDVLLRKDIEHLK